MSQNDDPKVTASTSVKIDNLETRIERILIDNKHEKVRLSSWSGGFLLSQPIVLSEPELIEILHQAIHAGVLPRNFIGKLRERIEI